MRWKPVLDNELPDWLGWPIAILVSPVVGGLIAAVWLSDLKAKIMGPSSEWRPWFAWHPVCITDGDAIWMEWIERRHHWNMTEYKLRDHA